MVPIRVSASPTASSRPRSPRVRCRCSWCRAGESAAFLGPWSVTVLASRVDDGPALVDLLTRLGLRTLADFAALPDAAVLARFGVAGARAHRLARGMSEHDLVPAPVPPELVEVIELDPPATRVDEAAFAAKMLADRLLGRLDELGLSCSQVIVEAETEHGERLTRCWRHEGALTPATLVDPRALAARSVAHRGGDCPGGGAVTTPTTSSPAG